MVSPLDAKLGRDLWRMKGQALAIAVVVGLGVLMLVMMDGLVNSLTETRDAYYARYRLAQVFAPLKRAPDRVLDDLRAIPGVAAVEGRVTGGALIDLPGLAVPARAEAISLPPHGPPRLNAVHLARGRLLDPTRADEILLLNGFAKAHGLEPGDRIAATMNGARRDFRIAGLVEAPEFLFSAPPGELMPDDSRFAVIWMNHSALAAAYDMDGAFNEALLSLTRGAETQAVLAAADRILEPYGGLGAYGLKDQISNRFITEEIAGLVVTSHVVPPVFLAVAAFLLNIVVSRMIRAEREQIGLLKAFGYTSFEVGLHYFKFIMAIAVGGAMLGCLFGVIGGRSLATVYQIYYKFPFLVFRVVPAAFVTGVAASVLAAAAGGILVLRGVFTLTPAVAMRAAAPADYSRAAAMGGILRTLLDQPSRMVLRRIAREPLRTLLAVIGIAAGMAISVAMVNVTAAFDITVERNFTLVDRSDVTLAFIEPLPDRVIHDLRRIAGVIEVEPFRSVPAVLRNGPQSYRGGISGLVAEPRLSRAVGADLAPLPIREDGVLLGSALAELLGVAPGDRLEIEVREGRRPVIEVTVAGVAETLIGSPAYMRIEALNRALKEPGRVSGAWLRIDAAQSGEIFRKLRGMPAVAGVTVATEARAALEKVMDSGAGAVRYLMTAIAAVITFGIVYNSARIAFAERARDLASLRAIGFTRAEAAFVLLGELAVIILLALPIGAVLGYFMGEAVSAGFSTDLYRVPALFVPEGYGAAAAAVLLAGMVSGWLVKRDVDRLDLVATLKARE